MVSGFTDDQQVREGNRRFADNWDLSAQRALTVTRTLIDAGVPSSSLFAAAFGSEQPVASNADAEGQAKNRRVEIAPVPRGRRPGQNRMSDHTQADAGRERDPIPTARESDQDRRALSAPWTSPPAPTRTRPPAPRPAAQRRPGRLARARRRPHGSRALPFHGSAGATRRSACRRRPRAGTSAWPPCSTPTRRTERDEAAPGSPRPSRRKRRPRGAGLRRRRYAHRRSPARRHPGQPGPRARHRPRAGAAPTRSCRCWTCTAISGPRSCQPPAAPIGTAGARQCRPAQFQQLVHRSLALMRQLSPGSAPVPVLPDALAWMEQFDGAVAAAKPRAVRPRLAPRVRARRLSPPPPSAAGPRRPDAPSDLRRARCPQ